MGTRCLVRVKDREGRIIVNMYRQWEGYPEAPGMGHELSEFLKGFKIVNGIPGGEHEPGTMANGLGCLAAQIVAHFKKRVGDVYLHTYDVVAEDCDAEYCYTVYHPFQGESVLFVLCEDYAGKVIYNGSPMAYPQKPSVVE